MKAILIKEDKSLKWEEVENPVIKPDEVLVKVYAAGVNRADLMQREGNYPPPPGCPIWPGLEISGEIVEIGEEAKENSDWKIGDKVCALLGGGGYAEYVAVRYDMLMPVPENCTMEEAAALPEAYATGYLNLFIEGNIKPGDTLLVTGGNSGLASVIIPMAKAFGIKTITTVRNDKKAESIKHLNADIVINTEKEPLNKALEKICSDGTSIDVTIDCLGGSVMGECLPYMTHGGRWIMIASLAGDITEINLRTVFVKNIRIIGSTLRSRPPKMKAEILKALVENVWSKIETGEIKPTIYKVLPITSAEEAQGYLQNSQSTGKVVMTVQ